MLSGLTGLRAVAALLVIIYHLNQRIPTGGMSVSVWSLHQFIGHLSVMVSVFFLLSGFFRSLSYWKNLDTPEKIPEFWSSLKDRWFRIAPAYYIVLIISLIATACIYGTSSMNMPAFFAGFAFLTWISPETLFPVLLNWPLWFISFDMIGWIMTSLCMMGLLWIGKKYWILYLLFLIWLSLSLHFLWIHLPWPHGEGISSIWFPTYNPFLFFLHFLFGIVAGWVVQWMKNREQSPSIYFDISVVVVTFLIGISIWMVRHLGDWESFPDGPYHFPWLTTLIALLFITLPFTKYIGGLLDSRFFTFTAKISFSLFLIHGVVMEVLRVYVFEPPLTFSSWFLYAICTFLFSYLAAWILYRYIELPCIPKNKNK